MICKLCEAFYLDEDSIFGLFLFSEICQRCSSQYEPKNSYEVIPISNGLIEYHYLYENMKLNRKQVLYLSKHLSIFYIYLNQYDEKYDLIIFLDDELYYESNELSDLLNDYKHIFIFSLMRKELMYKNLF